MAVFNDTSKKQTKGKKQTAQTPLKKGGGLVPKGLQQESKKDYKALKNVSKSSLARLDITIFPKEIPDFKAPGATKDGLVTEYLTQFIIQALADDKITEDNLLPKKDVLAKFLGVSVGTVQNAIRIVEDLGHVESKQRIGTVIRDVRHSGYRMRKQTSKRDYAVVAVKKFILERKLQKGDPMPSAREISADIGSAPNTTRLALEFLTYQGILHSRGTRGNKANWEIKELPDLSNDPTVSAIESETLIDQLERDLKQLIADSCAVGDKLPSHLALAEQFKVSIKTVHDAMKCLSEQGIIRSKRGRYGTFVCRKPETTFFKPEAGIFVPVENQDNAAPEESFYNYEKVENHLHQLISSQYKVGEKLPSMGQLAEKLGVSSNTIRKALQNLGESGIVTFTRGRYGGTFVSQIPKVSEVTDRSKSFEWVSINPETIKSYGTQPIKSEKTKR